MKYLLVVVVLAVCGALYFYFPNGAVDQPSGVVGVPEIKAESDSGADADVVDDKLVSTARRPAPPEVKEIPVVEVTEQQLSEVKRQEEEIAQMMREYDQLRSDPEAREEYRAAMKKKLEKYSQDVLPVAMSKMQQKTQ